MKWAVIIYLLSCLSIHMQAHASAAYCTQHVQSAQEQAHEIEKKAAEQLALQPDFCRRNALLEYLGHQYPKTDFSGLSTTDLISQAEKAKTEEALRGASIERLWDQNKEPSDADENWYYNQFLDPWQASLVPLPDQRMKAVTGTMMQWDSDWGHINQDFQKPEPMSVELKKQIQDNVDRLDSNRVHDPQENSASLRFAACASLGIANAAGCSQALKATIPSIVPTGSNKGEGTKFSDLQDWKDIMSNDKYDEGLRQMALLMVQRSKGPPPASANVMDDLVASFKKSNMSQKEAENAALKTMAVIANGGANTFSRVQELEKKNLNDPKEDVPITLSQKGKSLSFIASMMSWLDGYKSQQGEALYSLPKGVASTCDNAKSYHFWMIARMAQQMSQMHGVSATAAAQAAYTIENAYQLKREMGRPTDNPDGNTGNDSLEKNVYDASSLLDRGDLAFAASGAFYGAHFDQQDSVKINSDSSIPAMIDRGSVLDPLSAHSVDSMASFSKFIRWDDIFAPKAAFDNIKQQTDAEFGVSTPNTSPSIDDIYRH